MVHSCASCRYRLQRAPRREERKVGAFACGSVTCLAFGLLAGRARSPVQFRAAAAVRGGVDDGGATTPIEMMYFSASSTLIASGTTSLRGIIRKKPEVGFGVVGT